MEKDIVDKIATQEKKEEEKREVEEKVGDIEEERVVTDEVEK